MIITGAMTGSILALGMGFHRAAVAIAIGNLIMLIHVGLLGLPGTSGDVMTAALAVPHRRHPYANRRGGARQHRHHRGSG